ncbi:Dynein light chain Tctex-type 1 [Gigaspora margarita]|uniref:Dynein light chain Tctex-type 1 n=1 Tax=Gigaspora margarita TaxID=4874 RepID=A0A8H3WX40_GIGMA|nr:Dynein light chain Tctex-type 1 [Gigaspora margarita]
MEDPPPSRFEELTQETNRFSGEFSSFKDPKKTFNEDEVKIIVKEIVESTILQDSAYLHSRISNWNAIIVENTVKRLAALNKSIKYIVTCTIFEKNGAGIHATTTCHWDSKHDGSTTYRHDTNSMYVIVNVWGLSV